MLIIMPSDPTTTAASQWLEQNGILHLVMPIPESLGYKTSANNGIYLQAENNNQVMLDLSANGFVIMRVFKSFEIA